VFVAAFINGTGSKEKINVPENSNSRMSILTMGSSIFSFRWSAISAKYKTQRLATRS